MAELKRCKGVSCLSITDPGDSDIIRSLPGQVGRKLRGEIN